MTVTPDYYTDVVSCTEICPLALNCNVEPSLPKRYTPRGTTSRAQPGVRLMIVVTNPGKPQEQEDQLYSNVDKKTLASRAWRFTADTLEGKTDFSPTLDQLIDEASFLLGCSANEVLDQCVITNHVKCSTANSFSSYSCGKEKQQRLQISKTCTERYLIKELDFWKALKIVVFSATARDALTASGIHFDDYIAHPTALGKNKNREFREKKLQSLKDQLGL